jgi:hypothetical protein
MFRKLLHGYFWTRLMILFIPLLLVYGAFEYFFFSEEYPDSHLRIWVNVITDALLMSFVFSFIFADERLFSDPRKGKEKKFRYYGTYFCFLLTVFLITGSVFLGLARLIIGFFYQEKLEPLLLWKQLITLVIFSIIFTLLRYAADKYKRKRGLHD